MGTIWELDFYSRPVLDEQQKKVWEVLICESPLEVQRSPETLFRYSQYCPNDQVNSVWLRDAIEAAIAEAPQPPDKIRFFRRQMEKMITKACQDAGIFVQPSRRTVTLNRWLDQRMEEVYSQQPGFQPVTNPSVQYEALPPQPLPEVLIGQQWAFVTLEASMLQEMSEWDIGFSEAFPPDMVGLAPETKIPGLVIFSNRAKPLAAWMSGLELAFLKFESDPTARLLLETGASDRWILANLPNPAMQTEAKNFEVAKRKSQNVHFLAVQSDPQSEAFAGFWLLQEIDLS